MRELGNDRERYQAYLCSREWSLLKEQVHERAQGLCERCFTRPIDAVHHKTYARKYSESLSDLQGLCDGCHKFVHAKADTDPATVEDRDFHSLRVITRGGEIYVDCGRYCVDIYSSLAISIWKGACDPNIAAETLRKAIECGVQMKNDDASADVAASMDRSREHKPQKLIIRRAEKFTIQREDKHGR